MSYYTCDRCGLRRDYDDKFNKGADACKCEPRMIPGYPIEEFNEIHMDPKPERMVVSPKFADTCTSCLNEPVAAENGSLCTACKILHNRWLAEQFMPPQDTELDAQVSDYLERVVGGIDLNRLDRVWVCSKHGDQSPTRCCGSAYLKDSVADPASRELHGEEKAEYKMSDSCREMLADVHADLIANICDCGGPVGHVPRGIHCRA